MPAYGHEDNLSSKGPDIQGRPTRNRVLLPPDLPPRRKNLAMTVDTRRVAARIRPLVTYRNSRGPSDGGPGGPDAPENSPAAAERLLMAGDELRNPGVFVVPCPPGPPSFVLGGPLLLYPPSDPASLASYALSLEASPEPCGPLAKRGRGMVGRG